MDAGCFFGFELKGGQGTFELLENNAATNVCGDESASSIVIT
jgi:hypothetical protein